MALLLFPKGYLLPPEGSPPLASQPKEQTRHTAASGGVMVRGKLKLAEKCCIFSGISSNVSWLSVIDRGLWGTKKQHGMWL